MCVLVTQLCPTLCNSMDCIAHQAPLSVARTLGWVSFPPPEESSQARDWIWVSCIEVDSVPSESPGCALNSHTHTHTHSIQNTQQQKRKWCGNIFWIVMGNRDEINWGVPFSRDCLRRVCLCMKGVVHSTAVSSTKRNQITIAPNQELGSSVAFSSIFLLMTNAF